MIELFENLYVSGKPDSSENLKELGIERLISMIPGSENPFPEIEYHNIPIYDNPAKQLIGPARRAFWIFTSSRKKTLIYCTQGQSRSPMTCAFILGWLGHDGLAIVCQKLKVDTTFFDQYLKTFKMTTF